MATNCNMNNNPDNTMVRIVYATKANLTDSTTTFRETVLGSFKLVDLQAVIDDIANRIIEQSRGVFNLTIYEHDCDIGATRVIVDWLKTLHLPISPKYKGVKGVPVQQNYSVKQIIMIHEVADFLGLKKPLAYRGVRDVLYAWLKKAGPEPSAVAELWARTTADRDDHLRRTAVNAAFTFVEAEDGSNADGKIHNAYTTAFQSHPELLSAYNNRRDEYFSYKTRCVARQEREEAHQVRIAEAQARRQAEYEEWQATERKKKAFEVDRINRRGGTTIKREN